MHGVWKGTGRKFLLIEGVWRWGNVEGDWLMRIDPAMWYHGGTIGQQRFYCRFIALQIKAKIMGMPLRIYDKTP